MNTPPRTRKHEPSPLECDPIPLLELEEAVREVLFAPTPEGQGVENREPTVEELTRKFKLKRRR